MSGSQTASLKKVKALLHLYHFNPMPPEDGPQVGAIDRPLGLTMTGGGLVGEGLTSSEAERQATREGSRNHHRPLSSKRLQPEGGVPKNRKGRRLWDTSG